MLKEIFSDMKYNKIFLIERLLAVICAVIFGFLIEFISMYTMDYAEFLHISTIFALFMSVGLEAVFALQYSTKFSLALSMGRTRKSFMSSYALQAIINQFIIFAFILLIYKIEARMYSLISPQNVSAFELVFLYDIRFVMAMIICPPVLCMFIGTLYGRFGKKVSLACLWTLVVVINIINYFLNHSSKDIFEYISMEAWISIGILAALLMIATILYLGKKQAVR